MTNYAKTMMDAIKFELSSPKMYSKLPKANTKAGLLFKNKKRKKQRSVSRMKQRNP